jgi:hypothetical protein
MGVTVKSFDSPDDSRTPDKTRYDVVEVAGRKLARMTAQPGWRWSECVGSISGKDRCHERHVGVVLSGHFRVSGDDGSEGEVGPGDVYVIEPGHDGWVVGDEPYVSIELDEAAIEAFGRRPDRV